MTGESLEEHEEARVLTSLLLLTVRLRDAATISVLVVQIVKVCGIGLSPVLEGYHLSAVCPIQCVDAKRVGSVHGELDAVVVVVVLQLVV